MLGISIEELYTDSADWITIALSKARTWKENLDKLKDWYQWLQAYQNLHSLGIGFIATEYKEKNIPPANLQTASARVSIRRLSGISLPKSRLWNYSTVRYSMISLLNTNKYPPNSKKRPKENYLPGWPPTFRLSLTKPSKVPKWVSFKRISATMPAAYLFASYSTKFPLCCRACARVC